MQIGFREFVDFVWGGMNEPHGNATIWNSPKPGTHPNQDAWFKYPKDIDEIVSYCQFTSGVDLYISPFFYGDKLSPNTGRFWRNPVNATYSSTLYIDGDRFDPRNARIHPSMVICSSNHDGVKHYQAWWKLDRAYDAQDVSRACGGSIGAALPAPRNRSGHLH